MKKNILITGGAGFIGSHVADELLHNGYSVRVLDNLSPQVHGPDRRRPDYLNPEVELIVGDVRDSNMVERALKGIDAVYHFAAMVGVGQSMYEIEKYSDVNVRGTAVLLEALSRNPVERIVVASSMSIYGEGLYRSANGKLYSSIERNMEQLKTGSWELRNEDDEELVPIPTPETKTPALNSIYAISKYDQERSCMIFGRAYGIQPVAFRFFNVFGVRQSCSNPYTGVLAIFASRLLNGKPPLVYEDGYQKRDFVSVYDIATACRLAIEIPEAAGKVFNIGSGNSYTVLNIAEQIAEVFGQSHIVPELIGKYRMGDIRHCFADISLASQVLGYKPRVTLQEGLTEMSTWLEGREAQDRFVEACAELTGRGLTI